MDNELERQEPAVQDNSPEIVPEEPVIPESEPVCEPETVKEDRPIPRYEPDPSSSYRWVNPNAQAPRQPQKPVAKKKKGKGVFKKILAALLIIVFAFSSGLFGGLLGAGAIYLLADDHSVSQFPFGDDQDGNTDVQVGDRDNKLRTLARHFAKLSRENLL